MLQLIKTAVKYKAINGNASLPGPNFLLGMQKELAKSCFLCIILANYCTLYLNARQPGKVLNGLMRGSQKFSKNFHWNIISNFSKAFHVSLEMQSNSKNYVSVQDDEKTELVLWNRHVLFTLTSAVRDTVFIELLQKAFFEPNGKKRCLFRWIAKQF